MNSLPNQRFHVGVNRILIYDNRILLIKKSRGAYKGMFDLPGGGVENGNLIIILRESKRGSKDFRT